VGCVVLLLDSWAAGVWLHSQVNKAGHALDGEVGILGLEKNNWGVGRGVLFEARRRGLVCIQSPSKSSKSRQRQAHT
jgi:hypothetical protein